MTTPSFFRMGFLVQCELYIIHDRGPTGYQEIFSSDFRSAGSHLRKRRMETASRASTATGGSPSGSVNPRADPARRLEGVQRAARTPVLPDGLNGDGLGDVIVGAADSGYFFEFTAFQSAMNPSTKSPTMVRACFIADGSRDRK